MEKMNDKNKDSLDAIQLNNTYTYRRPNFIRWKGSVIPHVLPSTIVVTLFTVVICILHLHVKINLSIPLSFVAVLSFVVGLLLTYRTNTAYDRYWEGRRLWSTVVLAVRTLTRIIWVNVKEEGTDDILQKKTAINLLLGFAVATKHYLREEEGSQFDDLKPLISNIKSDLPGFEPLDDQDLTENIVKASKLKLGRTLSVRFFKSSIKPHKRRKGTPSPINHNLPLEISLYLSSYIDDQSQKKNADSPTTTAMYNSLNVLVDCLTHFERILRSPIPLAYSIHLSHTVWIYCLSLPFQLVATTKYVTIPIVFIATFVLMGIMQIGEEIENPFGYDANDLDLDDFCEHIRRELNTITARKRPTLKDWVYSEENHPFGPQEISAAEARKLSLDEVRSLLTIASENRTSVDKTRETIKEEDEPPIDNVAVKMD